MWKAMLGYSLVVCVGCLAACTFQPADRTAGAGQYSEVEQGALKCYPRILYKGDTLTIVLSADHPRGLAIRDPSDNWYYLQGESSQFQLMAPGDFARATRIEIPTDEIEAVRWDDGRAQSDLIFRETGEYLVYMANNLETEPENTFYLENTVYYYDEPRRGP